MLDRPREERRKRLQRRADGGVVRQFRAHRLDRRADLCEPGRRRALGHGGRGSLRPPGPQQRDPHAERGDHRQRERARDGDAVARDAPGRDAERRQRPRSDRLAVQEAPAVVGEFAGALVAPGGVLLEALQAHRLDVPRQVRALLGRRARGLLDDLLEEHERGHRPERRPAGEHLVEDRAKRVYVAAAVRAPMGALGLLRGQVDHGAHDGARLRELHLRLLVEGEAEVGELRQLAVLQKDIAGLDVAVDYAGGVRRGDRLGDRPGDGHRLLDGHAASADGVVERWAVDELHRHVVAALPLADLVDRDDILVLQPRGGARLPLEATRRSPPNGCREEHLEGDRPIERLVAHLVDDGLRAASELPHEYVLAEFLGHGAPPFRTTGVTVPFRWVADKEYAPTSAATRAERLECEPLRPAPTSYHGPAPGPVPPGAPEAVWVLESRSPGPPRHCHRPGVA